MSLIAFFPTIQQIKIEYLCLKRFTITLFHNIALDGLSFALDAQKITVPIIPLITGKYY